MTKKIEHMFPDNTPDQKSTNSVNSKPLAFGVAQIDKISSTEKIHRQGYQSAYLSYTKYRIKSYKHGLAGKALSLSVKAMRDNETKLLFFKKIQRFFIEKK